MQKSFQSSTTLTVGFLWATGIMTCRVNCCILSKFKIICALWQIKHVFQKLLSYLALKISYIVYVHCREEGCIGLYISDDQDISRGPRDVPRAKPEGHLEGQGTSRGPREISRSEGMYNPMHPDSRQYTAILSSLIYPLEMYQKIHPYIAIRIDSVKSNA